MSVPLNTSLDNCGCCEPEPAQPQIHNRPGLPALAYRAGTYASFFQHMRDQIGSFTLQDGDFAGQRPLASLTTRAADDPAIALLDASAIVNDVLTFYQERIANEGFLRTATERRSILELARSIGYELNPGVAASVYLAFSLEDAPGAPGMAEIPAGTRVQSIPPQGKLPQSFETSETINAHIEWNALRPRLSAPQNISTNTSKIYLQGTATNLKPGDRLLIDSAGAQRLARVINVELQSEQKRTLVSLDGSNPSSYSINLGLPQGHVDIAHTLPLTAESVNTQVRSKRWSDQDLSAFLTFNKWDQKELQNYLLADRRNNPAASGAVYSMRASLGFFGNTAPLYGSMPKNQGGTTLYPGQDWDTATGWPIWKSQQSNDYYQSADAYLERVVQGVLADSWVCLEVPGSTSIYKIESVIERSVAAFGLNNKVSGIWLKTPAGVSLNNNSSDKPASYTVRTTTAHLLSEALSLIELPLTADLTGGAASLELDNLALGLKPGQSLILTGERTDTPGLMHSEVLTIKEINHIAGFTVLNFENGLQYPYKRSSVSLNANVALATHGESTTEILGSGNGGQSNQVFSLKKPPLTHVSAPSATGSASTLQLRINNLLWSQTPSLFGLPATSQSYTVRIEDDGKANIIFGDGKQGSRLPSGVNNVVATYRSGIGLDGQVAAGSLTLLQSKPLGVRGVNNPLSASGAGDPEKMDDARSHAPLTVRTLERIVSREDYEDFGNAFAGIGKAQAIELWNGGQRIIHLTVAGADGTPITNSAFLQNLIKALDAARDPAQVVKIDTFDQLLFDLSANVAVDDRYIVKDVFAAIQNSLIETFSFAKRTFGQPVSAAEVITCIQKVAGIVYVDLDALFPSGGSSALNQLISANIAHAPGSGAAQNAPIQRAQLLLLNSMGVKIQEVPV